MEFIAFAESTAAQYLLKSFKSYDVKSKMKIATQVVFVNGSWNTNFVFEQKLNYNQLQELKNNIFQKLPSVETLLSTNTALERQSGESVSIGSKKDSETILPNQDGILEITPISSVKESGMESVSALQPCEAVPCETHKDNPQQFNKESGLKVSQIVLCESVKDNPQQLDKENGFDVCQTVPCETQKEHPEQNHGEEKVQPNTQSDINVYSQDLFENDGENETVPSQPDNNDEDQLQKESGCQDSAQNDLHAVHDDKSDRDDKFFPSDISSNQSSVHDDKSDRDDKFFPSDTDSIGCDEDNVPIECKGPLKDVCPKCYHALSFFADKMKHLKLCQNFKILCVPTQSLRAPDDNNLPKVYGTKDILDSSLDASDNSSDCGITDVDADSEYSITLSGKNAHFVQIHLFPTVQSIMFFVKLNIWLYYCNFTL